MPHSLDRLGFNPRPRKGATGGESNVEERVVVSIHAPVRERPEPNRQTIRGGKFQSTPP